MIGQGGFGKVLKVKYLADHNIYALKLVKLHLGIDENLMEHKVYREIQAITKMQPINILRYYTCWIEQLDDIEQIKENKVVDKLKTKLNKTKKIGAQKHKELPYRAIEE